MTVSRLSPEAWVGLAALCVDALLEAGQVLAWPHLRNDISKLEQLPIVGRLLDGEKFRAIDRSVPRISAPINAFELLNRTVRDLSEDQKHRIAMGRAMMLDFDELLVDEPSMATIWIQASNLSLLLQKIGKTIILTTRNQAIALCRPTQP
jgi:ABC-type lipoprotein export system ATPase subunit